MRLDVFLHKLCLLKSRSMAGEACQRGKITLDGAPAKASREVRPGARIGIDVRRGLLEIEVIDVPAGNVPKARAPEYYRVLRREAPADEFP